MHKWLNLADERKLQILNQVSNQQGLPAYAIEKDWWVTLALKAAFSTPWEPYLVFKGGTSLSKSWGIIERFSEDIDLAIDRKALGFAESLTSTQVKKLRKASSEFISTTFKNDFENSLAALGIQPQFYKIQVQATDQPDIDPRIIELTYASVVDPNAYIQNKVIIEIGARSLREPCCPKPIRSIISESFPTQPFSVEAFNVMSVEPQRTFLEKVFLLHEEFLKPKEKMRSDRKSRHLYDLERLMDSEYAIAALNDQELYQSIIAHRKQLTPIRGISYDDHHFDKVNFIPPDELMGAWEKDYNDMRQMIYGATLPFPKLIERLTDLRNSFRELGKKNSSPITMEKSAKIIVDAKAASTPGEYTGKEGAIIQIPVAYRADPNLPESPENKTERFVVNFYVRDGQLNFREIEIV